MATYYNLTGHRIRGGGMAEIGGIVRPAEGWPASDSGESDYVADYRNFTRLNPMLRDRFGAPGPKPAEKPHRRSGNQPRAVEGGGGT